LFCGIVENGLKLFLRGGNQIRVQIEETVVAQPSHRTVESLDDGREGL